jgi:uncharacterized protein YbjT (DUF2867 family)
MANLHAVTGAFGYSGKYIAQRLLQSGKDVITLTNSVNRPNPSGLKAYPLDFDNPAALVQSLQGVNVLYNTYWVRFNHKAFTHADAVANTLTLFSAARKAGVQRVVHVSITNPNIDSPLEYFSGKAQLEKALMESGMSYTILRPTVLFGKEDILINNIAWMLRRFPIFGVFGDGRYCLQPIYVDDLAKLAVQHGRFSENVILNAIGPETFTYRDLVRTLGEIIRRPRPIIRISPRLGYLIGSAVGRLVGDVTITWDEIKGLMSDLLHVNTPPTGTTKLTDWAPTHAATLGNHYASELARRRTS